MKNKSIGFVVDNTSVFKQEEWSQLNVGAMFNLKALSDDEKNYDEFDHINDFYQYLYDNKQFGKTSTASLGDIKTAYDQALEQFDQIIVIPTSSKVSSTYANCCVVAKEYSPKQVIVIDSNSVVGAPRYLVEKGNALINQGKNFTEIGQELSEFAFKTTAYIIISDFSALEKNGRIGKAKSQIATLLNIKAVVGINSQGVEIIGKFRTIKKAVKFLSNKIFDEYDNSYTVYCGHIFNPSDFAELEQLLNSNSISYSLLDIPPIIGLHGGNQLIGITYVKK